MSLDPAPDEMRRLARLALDRALDARTQIREARVHTPPDPTELQALLAEPLPREGKGLADCIERFHDRVLPRATRVDHPRFFGYVPAPGSFASVVGDLMAAFANPFVGSWLGGASMAQLELVVLGWLREALGLPAEWSSGILTSGGSLANLSALAAAREACPAPLARQTIYTSSEAHYSVSKAARILGYTDEQIVALPVDLEQRLATDGLATRLESDLADGFVPAAIVPTVGTTSTGAVDDVAACAAIGRRHGAWIHVDGAYGAAMALCPEETAIREALATADSLTLDPHKWLYAGIESGCLLTRRAGSLEQAFTGDGAYLQDLPRDAVNLFERGPELTRGGRALKLWTLLRGLGVDALADAVRHDQAMARRAADRLLADPRIKLVTPPRMSVFSFAVPGSDEGGRRLVEALHRDGFCFLSSSRVAGSFVLRFCVVNHRTTEQDIDDTVDRVLALLDELPPDAS